MPRAEAARGGRQTRRDKRLDTRLSLCLVVVARGAHERIPAQCILRAAGLHAMAAATAAAGKKRSARHSVPPGCRGRAATSTEWLATTYVTHIHTHTRIQARALTHKRPRPCRRSHTRCALSRRLGGAHTQDTLTCAHRRARHSHTQTRPPGCSALADVLRMSILCQRQDVRTAPMCHSCVQANTGSASPLS